MKTKVMILLISLSGLIATWFFSSFGIVKHNERDLRDSILSLNGDVDKVRLVDATPFEWEKAYFFAPYTRKEYIYETIGFRWFGIRETTNDAQMQVVFTNENKVVCYSFGSPVPNKYYFDVYYISDVYSQKQPCVILYENSKSVL